MSTVIWLGGHVYRETGKDWLRGKKEKAKLQREAEVRIHVSPEKQQIFF